MDYAMQKGVSLSTLRRQIKANKVEYRVESGRYLLWMEGGGQAAPSSIPPSASGTASGSPIEKLEFELRKAQEEIAELKMLIALYEEKISGDRFQN
jgi:hypothetical protein